MNNEKEIRNFYEEEAAYENSILITKSLVEKVLNINIDKIKEKIKFINKEIEFSEYISLLTAVIGRKTNQYYYCQNPEDTKYYELEVGKVYKWEELNPDIQSRISNKQQLNLQARAILAEQLRSMTINLKEIFSLNVEKGDGTLSTIDSNIVLDRDIDNLNNIIKYIDLMIDKTGRLKILVAERDVFAFEQAKEEYSQKSSIQKWFYKTFNKEKNVINDIAEKQKGKM